MPGYNLFLMRILGVVLWLPTLSYGQNIIKSFPKAGSVNILIHPSDQLVCEGASVSFQALAAVPPPNMPAYQWQRSMDGQEWDDIPGAVDRIFDGFKAVTRAHNRSQLRVKVTSGADYAYSFPAMLLVESGIYFSKEPEKATVAEGGAFVFTSEAQTNSGNGVFSYQWQVSPYGSGVWSDLAKENGPELRLNAITQQHNGNSYRVVATTFGGCQSAQSPAVFLMVQGAPVISISPIEKTVCAGEDVQFFAQMVGGSGKEACQWQVATQEDPENFQDLPGATELQLKLGKADPSRSGQWFRAALKTDPGRTYFSSPAHLLVHGSFSFKQHPQNATVCPNESAVFEVVTRADGAEPDIIWQVSNSGGASWVDLDWAKAKRLVVTQVGRDKSGSQYRVLAQSNTCGSIFSDAATLFVADGVEFTQHPADLPAPAVGSPAVFEAAFKGAEGGAYSITWEWSGNGGASWQFMPGGNGNRLVIPKFAAEMTHNRYRMKVLDKKCGLIAYSQAARILDAD